MKNIFVLIVLNLTLLSISKAECINCSVTVAINKNNVQKFLDVLMTINSMPLVGHKIQNNSHGKDSLVIVETYQEYAAANKISSFDIANHLLHGFGNNPEWGIKKISANVEIFSETPSNVGTIGH